MKYETDLKIKPYDDAIGQPATLRGTRGKLRVRSGAI